jgi:YVTN family beta-propeller protein
VVRAVPQGDATQISALDSSSGGLIWTHEIPGKLEVKVASERGNLVALGSPRDGSGYGFGRSSTTLVIAGPSLSAPRTIKLDGNYQPEAFSTDGGSLFVVQFLPAERPNRYRVRRLDLSTGKVGGVYTVDADLQEAMQGTARIQAGSTDGRRLYTLYTLDGPGGISRAFVHVLSLDELWAHCIDLPSEFASARETSTALTVSPDGRHVYVADARSGTVASLDTESLSVESTEKVSFGSTGGQAQIVAGPAGQLFLAKGSTVQALDSSTLEMVQSWGMTGRITGLQVGNDGRRLYIGLRDKIEVVDTTTGEILPELNDVGDIEQLGESIQTTTDELSNFECAC